MFIYGLSQNIFTENSVGDRNLYWKVGFGLVIWRSVIHFELYTCDGSYDCLNFSDYKNDMFEGGGGEIIDRIKYFGNTSHRSLKKIHSEGKKLDLIFIDGRISPEDCKLFSQVMSPNCVFVFDDFEGVEKGVVNAIMLRNVFKVQCLLSRR